MASLRLRHYLRVTLHAPAGAPEIVRELASHDIEAEKYTASASEAVLLTRPVEERRMAAAVIAIAKLASVRGAPVRLRVEELAS